MALIGSGNVPEYPGQLDQVEARSDGDIIDFKWANDMQWAAIIIQQTLGTNPQGTYGSVVARLDAIHPFSRVSTTQTTLTAPINTEQEMMSFSVPANSLAVGDAMDFSFDGNTVNVGGNTLQLHLRLNTTNYITFPLTHSQITSGWAYVITGRLSIRSTSEAIFSAAIVYETTGGATTNTTRVDLATASGFNGTGAFDLSLRAERDNASAGMTTETGYVRRISAST